MPFMKKKFYLRKNIVVDKRIHNQSVQQIRQIRAFPRYKTFAIGDLIYLFVSSVASLYTRYRKLEEDWIGPLQIKAALL